MSIPGGYSLPWNRLFLSHLHFSPASFHLRVIIVLSEEYTWKFSLCIATGRLKFVYSRSSKTSLTTVRRFGPRNIDLMLCLDLAKSTRLLDYPRPYLSIKISPSGIFPANMRTVLWGSLQVVCEHDLALVGNIHGRFPFSDSLNLNKWIVLPL